MRSGSSRWDFLPPLILGWVILSPKVVAKYWASSKRGAKVATESNRIVIVLERIVFYMSTSGSQVAVNRLKSFTQRQLQADEFLYDVETHNELWLVNDVQHLWRFCRRFCVGVLLKRFERTQNWLVELKKTVKVYFFLWNCVCWWLV